MLGFTLTSNVQYITRGGEFEALHDRCYGVVCDGEALATRRGQVVDTVEGWVDDHLRRGGQHRTRELQKLIVVPVELALKCVPSCSYSRSNWMGSNAIKESWKK